MWTWGSKPPRTSSRARREGAGWAGAVSDMRRMLTRLSTILSLRMRSMGDTESYAALHAAIVAGDLSPGERLVEEELAERLGQSRGGIRSASGGLRPHGPLPPAT